ncbi:MAG: hypothetical protein II978_07485 [Clostridia bacterium]|nr:hypothetical protein [Clostridia bacterium]
MTDITPFENLKRLLEEKTENLKLESDAEGYFVTDGIQKIRTFPLICYEERLLHGNESVCYTYIVLYSKGKIFEPEKMVSSTALDFKKYNQCYGVGVFSNFGEEEIDIFFNVIKILLVESEPDEIYKYMGWSTCANYCICGCFKVEKDQITKIRNDIIKTDIVLSLKKPEEICAFMNFAMSNVLSDGFCGRLIQVYSMCSYIKPLTLKATNKAMQALLSLVGKTGMHKTSLANACFNLFDVANCSFEDSEASIRQTLQRNKIGVTIIDDFKCHTKENEKTYEHITRLMGDVGTTGKRVNGKNKSEEIIEGLAVITGEIRPRLQQSSYARILFVDLESNPVDLDILSELQRNKGDYITFVVLLIQYVIKQPDFATSFVCKTEKFRNELLAEEKYKGMHSRYYDMYGWLAAMWECYSSFLNSYNIKDDYDFKTALKDYIFAQNSRYDNDPVKLFLIGYKELLASNEIILLKTMSVDTVEFDVLDDDDRLFIQSRKLFKKIYEFWKNNGIDFPCSERALRNVLTEQNLLVMKNGKTTEERKTKSNRSFSGFTLRKYLFLNFGGQYNGEF